MLSDPIADYLTRIRNAQRAQHRVVDIPASKMKKEITRILYEKGYILNYKIEDPDNDSRSSNKQGNIKVALRYLDKKHKVPVIQELQRVSKPGLRQYTNSREVPRILNGLGVAIISTSRGVMTDKEARKEKVGGEVVCYVH